MLIECEKCQTKYEVPDSAFADEGRNVKCNSCGHVWFQPSAKEMIYAKIEEPELEEVIIEEVVSFEDSVVEEDSSQIEIDVEEKTNPEDISMEEVMSKIKHELEGDETVSKIEEPIKSKTNNVKEEKVTPEVKPKKSLAVLLGLNKFSFKAVIKVLSDFYANLASKIFAITSFATLLLVTIAVLYSARDYMVNEYPKMYIIYKTAGIEVKAPGEDLEIINFSAKYVTHRNSRSLKIDAELVNKSSSDKLFPAMDIILKDKNNNVLKILSPRGAEKIIAPDKSYPFTLEFRDIPEEAVAAEIVAVK